MRVLICSHTTGYQLRAFNDAADALGIELVFATDRCHKLEDPWQDHAIAIRFHDPLASVDAIVDRARTEPIDGVIAVGDRPVVLAARAAEALHVPWHSVAGALASTDKRLSRAAIASAGLPSPPFAVIPSNFAPRPSNLGPRTSDLGYPVVLKPSGLSGSRGVIRVNDDREFVAAFERIRALLARPQIRAARAKQEDHIVVERYVDGAEFAIEGVLTAGRLQVFAIFDKPEPLDGPFFEETIYVTPSRLPASVQERVADHVDRASRALGLWHGPLHAECRIASDGTIYVLEVAARPIGGLCSRVLAFEGDASLEEVLLRHAAGDTIEGVRVQSHGAAVMMIPIPRRGLLKGVAGEEAARAVPGVTDVRIAARIGQLLEPLPEAGSYLGFIFARGATPSDAERSVKNAHIRLAFDVSRELYCLP
ncbi:MAG TPA: ATP-grasp domain-containing protein [Vicinamibacterales bacterium]|jgi:biotin carboxylase|nr:ATP-grasp domain-containing protein [Vicinamibacterales bacterium]